MIPPLNWTTLNLYFLLLLWWVIIAFKVGYHSEDIKKRLRKWKETICFKKS